MRHSFFLKCMTVMCLLLSAPLCSNSLLASAQENTVGTDEEPDFDLMEKSDMGSGSEEIKLPDPDRTGSVTIKLWYDGRIVTGGTLKVYRVGEIYINEDKNRCGFNKTGAFTAVDGKIFNVMAQKAAKQLQEFVSENDLSPDYFVENKEGRVILERLQTGLYLIVQSEAAEGYEALNPFLVSVPVMEEGEYVYDVDARGKFELKKAEPQVTPEPEPGPSSEPAPGSSSEPTPEPPSRTPSESRQEAPSGLLQQKTRELPQTGQLNWPVPVLAAAGITLLLIGLALRLYGGGKDNEWNGRNE